MVVVANTPTLHNMVVCTLCSCYPWPVLGFAADLVQEPALPRSSRVRAPCRAARVGLELGDDAEIASGAAGRDESSATAYSAAWLDALKRLLAERGLIDTDRAPLLR